jgi:CRP/FNR family transcriptional regulator, cyclic AMP receptor protein
MTGSLRADLAAHPFLNGLDDADVARLAGAARRITRPAGHRFFEEGGTADRFWLISSGQVALDLHLPGRGTVTMETFGPGEVVGWSWLCSPYRWTFGAVATQPTGAFELDGARVLEIFDADPAFGLALTRRFVGVLAARLHGTRIRLLDLYGHPGDHRVGLR